MRRGRLRLLKLQLGQLQIDKGACTTDDWSTECRVSAQGWRLGRSGNTYAIWRATQKGSPVQWCRFLAQLAKCKWPFQARWWCRDPWLPSDRTERITNQKHRATSSVWTWGGDARSQTESASDQDQLWAIQTCPHQPGKRRKSRGQKQHCWQKLFAST